MQRFLAISTLSLVFVLTTPPNALATSISFTRPLSLGVSGSDVSQLQQFLKEQGFYTYSEITGYFGQITKQAVIDFQKAYDINPIGIVGPQTQAKITSLSSDSTTSNSPNSFAPRTFSSTELTSLKNDILSELRTTVTRQSSSDSSRTSSNASELTTTINTSIASNASKWASGSGGTISYTGGSVGVGTTTSTAKLAIDNTAVTTGSELIANGTFTGSATGWTLGSNVAYGTNNVISTYAGGDPSVSTTFSSVAGHTYLLTFTISAANAPMYFYFNNNTLTYNLGPFSNGTITVAFQTDFTGTETIYFDDWNWNTGDTWTLDNVSIKQTNLPSPTLKVIGFNGSTWLS